MLVEIYRLVQADIGERDRIGRVKYGSSLTEDTPINSLQYAYEEALDLTMYLKKKLLEEEGD